MKDETGRVISVTRLGENYHLMQIEAEYISRHARAGQFIMVRVSPGFDPAVRKPFGILRAKPPHIWIFFQEVGHGTAMLKEMKPADHLAVLGPLGNGFPELQGENMLLLAGGCGIAPIFSAAEQFAAANRVVLVYGGRRAVDLHLRAEIEGLPLQRVYYYTEDGGFGLHGRVTTDLAELLTRHDITVTLSCGPHAMLHALARAWQGRPLRHFVSLEAYMGCGFGVCHSCVVQGADGMYKKVCSDGPVFPLEDIQW